VALADFMADRGTGGVNEMTEWNRACRAGDYPAEWTYSNRNTFWKAVKSARRALG
jgi:hypothetical protein